MFVLLVRVIVTYLVSGYVWFRVMFLLHFCLFEVCIMSVL
jgi:hypothetical protein